MREERGPPSLVRGFAWGRCGEACSFRAPQSATSPTHSPIAQTPSSTRAGSLAVGRRPAFGLNGITVLGRFSLAELAAEAAEVAGAARTYGDYGGVGGDAPSAATIAKSLLAASIFSMGCPIVPQVLALWLALAHSAVLSCAWMC